jgi:hypothetical protein
VPSLKRLTSPELPSDTLGDDFARADIEFEGVEHSGSSYEARVFLNNPEANAGTETTPEAGYAGSYYVFGHGGCYGDEGHCDIRPRGPYDPRPPHGLLPTRKVLIATNAVRKAKGENSVLTVTVVPRLMSTTDRVREDEVLPHFQSVSVITYQ